MWLKEHNQECHDIEFKMKNFDWMGEDEERELLVAGDSVFCERRRKKHISAEEDLGPNASSNVDNIDVVHGLCRKNDSSVVIAKDVPIQESIEKSLEALHSTTSVSSSH